jgi:O-antigen biosynthesis protein WbqP
MIIVALRNITCIIGLMLLMPLFFIISIFVLIEDGLPVFFIQKRLGKNLTVFNIYKIRTMKKNTPQAGTHDVNKEFILKTGAVIRRLKLDEFPQLINVLRGELNLIGSRPGLENQHELREYREKRKIFVEKPGITGLAQVTGFDMSDPEKLSKVDEFYISNRCFKMDCEIFMATFFTSMRRNLIKITNEI